ncbi:hypothetical protein FS837_011848 [Tulasnella sp. UAMH 9824]|nr:hypothetical protein FS837_011848 [Tulasnella sp. UAMH 9824]
MPDSYRTDLGPDNRSRGYGTVLLATAEDAGRAIDMFNGYSWQTRILEVRHDRMPLDATMYENNYGGPQLQMPFHTQAPAVTTSVSNASFSDNPLLGSVGLASSVSASVLGSSSSGSVLGPSSPTQSSASGAAPFSLASHLNANSISRSGSRMGMHSAGRSLFVGNLPFQCQWQDLKDLFRQIGPVVRADVALGPDGRSRGFGTVLFQTEADADRAVKTLNGFEYNGRMIKVHHDRFTQNTTGTTSPPPFPALQPHLQLQQTASFMGTNPHQPLIPSHIHTTVAALSAGGVGFAGAPFHSQPTSPFDGFPPPTQLAMGQQPALYEQYLNQQQQIALQQPPALQRSLTEQVMGATGGAAAAGGVTANLVALLKEQVESIQQQAAASISQAPSVTGSRPSTSHGSGIAGSTRPASAMSGSASSGYVKLDYPSLLNPPPAPTPPTAASAMGVDVTSNVPKADGDAMDEEAPPPQTPAMNNPSSPGSNHPGTIAIPPPPSTFTAGGMVFSPLGRGGLPPMTPSMPGFTFHPQQAGTPPGMLPHFLSPGIGPTSPQHFTAHLGRQGSFHAAPGGPHPATSMQAAFAMMYGTPPMIHTPPVHHHPHMMLTPGPRLDQAGSPVGMNGAPPYPLSPGHHPMHQMQPAWSPPVPPGGEGMTTPYAAVEGQRDYFVAGAVAQEEHTGYFPPVAPTTSSSSGGGGGSIGPSDASVSMSAEDSGSSGPLSAPVLQDAAVIIDTTLTTSSSPLKKPPSSDPAATIRARVAGLTLDEKTVPSMVNEIAVASGLGMGTAKKAMAAAAGGAGGAAQNGNKLPSLWMSQKNRFNRSNAPSPLSGSSPEQEAVVSFSNAAAAGATSTTMSRNASGPLPRLNEKDVKRPMGMFGLPSPGRRASWAAEPGSRRPEVVASSVNEADSR